MLGARTLRTVWAAAAVALFCGPADAGGLSLAHPYAEGSTVDFWARGLKECLEQKIGLYVEVIGGGTLGRSSDLADAVSQGYIDLAILPAKALGQRWPGLSRLAQSEPVFDPGQMVRLSRSSRFLVDLNEIGSKGYGLAVLSIGWQFSVLAGIGGKLDDGALLGARFLVPAAAMKEADLVQDAVRRVGAEPILLEARDTQQALQFRAVDGAIVDLDMARLSMAQRAFDQLQWSADYAPFSSPIVIVMNTNSFAYQEIFGGFDKLFSSGSDSCLAVTDKFNENAIAEMRDLTKEAQGSSVQVIDVSPVWRTAFSEALTARGRDDDPVAEAVRKELRQ